LTIAGVPVGAHLPRCADSGRGAGSIIALVGTDAPLLPHQLERLARRIGLGVGRSGAISSHGSGDIFLAFSTANEEALAVDGQIAREVEFIRGRELTAWFEAVVQSVDEAIINSMVANKRMQGVDGRVVEALPHGEVVALLRRYGRWEAPATASGGDE
jgi:D-aminopeptidase